MVDETIIDIENNKYNFVQIGSQYWSSKNLKAKQFRNGDGINNFSNAYLNMHLG
jgi:hypothetical protein